MSSFRAALFAALVVLGTALAVPFAGAIAPSDAAATGVQTDGTNATDANGTTVGAQVSSFMQTSGANASSAVESGMFEAEYETADNRSAVVDRRADRIERRIAQLRDRKQRLVDREGKLSRVAYTTQMTRVVAEIEALEREIDETEPKARAAGVDAARFERLRGNVSDLRGPAVEAAADAIPGRGPPADRGPGDRGPGDRGDGGAGDGGVGSPGDGDASGDGASDGAPGNESAGNEGAGDGASGGGASGDDPGNDQGPPSDGDRGGDGGPPDDGRPLLTQVWW